MSRGNKENQENISLVGNNLKYLRQHKGLSMEQFASQVQINPETLKSYESNHTNPSLKNLVKIADYFEISIDFLLMGKNTICPKNLRLILLAKKIDALRNVDKHPVVSFIETLLGQKVDFPAPKREDINLTENIHENIRILRESKGLSQKFLSEYLDVTPVQASLYEKNSIPSVDKLIKLSQYFDVSLQFLITGNRLFFRFEDEHFGDVILKADYFLSLEDHNILIRSMEAVLKK